MQNEAVHVIQLMDDNSVLKKITENKHSTYVCVYVHVRKKYFYRTFQKTKYASTCAYFAAAVKDRRNYSCPNM